jgi:DNA modification methylase
MNTNRNYILMEKEKEYIDIINKRIAEHNNPQP